MFIKIILIKNLPDSIKSGFNHFLLQRDESMKGYYTRLFDAAGCNLYISDSNSESPLLMIKEEVLASDMQSEIDEAIRDFCALLEKSDSKIKSAFQEGIFKSLALSLIQLHELIVNEINETTITEHDCPLKFAISMPDL